MTRKKVQKKNSTTSLSTTKDIALSIQFSLDGFSFCVTDTIENKDVYFTEYVFEKTLNSPEELLSKIETVFAKDTNLQLIYSSVEVIHQNNLSTIVPEKYFKEEALATYLNYNIKTFKSDLVVFDTIDALNAKNIYIPYVNINNYLFQNFGEFVFKHHITVFIEKLLKTEAFNEKTMYVNVHKNSFDLVVLESGKLIFSNSFIFNTKEDFLYYILFSAEQLKLNSESFRLFFSGAIEEKDNNYQITYKYVKNVFFIKNKNTVFNDLKIPNHSNFILLG